MISPDAIHPFTSHFPIALFVAGVLLLFLGRDKSRPVWVAAGSINLSFGLLAVMLAVFTGLFSADIGLFSTEEIEGHQGWSFLTVILFAVCVVFSYTRTFSPAAITFYFGNFLALCASVYSGYLLVF